ncbi:MAG: D-alanine--D-alanine ligase [Ectothiorhodospiraceae bacterium]|nr:D-alanine--D-alanine ligase [Ectothiorhodospiraceae bacterium]
MEERNIFIVGIDGSHLAQLQTLPDARHYRFHPLFTREELKSANRFPVARLLHEGREQLRRFGDRIDAIVGYWDFPVSTALPILRQPFRLPGPTLESVLKCEHKYWSRLEQARVAPEHVPPFCAVDPFHADPLSVMTVEFPFWIKPGKAVLSCLGFRVRNHIEFQHAIDQIRRGIRRFGDPFNLILDFADLPPEVATVDGNHCIAEGLISAGHQCTLEGHVYQGRVTVYGVVDSLREGPAQSSFSRYQYPSRLPSPVQARMSEIADRVMRHIGYDCAPFNMELYWEADSDRIWLLEINTRISKSHAPLFRMVDGCYHHQVMVNLGLGREPAMPSREGRYACAAKFMMRRYEDATVQRVPTPQEIQTIEADMPGVIIELEVDQDMQLSSLRNQDSYTYEVATVFIGARDNAELEAKYERVLRSLPLEFREPVRPVPPPAAAASQ